MFINKNLQLLNLVNYFSNTYFLILRNIYKTLEENFVKVVNQNFVYSKILFKDFKAFLKKIWQLFSQKLYLVFLVLKLGLSLGLFDCTIIDPFEDTTPPTLTISTKTSPLEQYVPNKIIFTFDEDVSNFTSDKIEIEVEEIETGTEFLGDRAVIRSEFVTNSPSKYLLGITPKKSGKMTIKIFAYTVQDNANNFNPSNFTTNFFINKDVAPPILTISTNSPLEKGSPVNIFFTFNEDVTNFTLDDIKISGVKVNTIKFTTNSKKEYTWSVTPIDVGDLKINVPAGSLQDLPGNSNTNFIFDIPISPSGTFTYTVSFILNGATFLDPKITTLKVNKDSSINKDQLKEILSYSPTGPKPNIQAVTRDIFEWRNNGTKYDFFTPVTSNLTLEAVWSNSCGKVETFHPANRDELKTYTDKAISDNTATNLNHIDTSAITTMIDLFYNSSFNGKIDCWNVANVTEMSFVFQRALSFNQNIGNWNVDNVNNMSSMFQGALSFNQNIGNWNVDNVTNMSSMFQGANAFDQDIGNWNVDNVNNMYDMFQEALSFNQDIGNWNVGNVTDMSFMFWYASEFNKDIGNWNVGNVTDMSSMFKNALSFNKDIGNWNVGNVTDMSSMFKNALSFNKDIRNWNVGNVTDMSSMFKNALSFNQDIRNWNVGNVNNMSSMFFDASKFDKDIGDWNVSNVTDMSSMFQDASSFNQDIGNWDVSNVEYMSSMFQDASSFNQDIGNWDVSNVIYMSSMFQDASSFNQDIGNWDVSNVIYMSSMFQDASSFNQDIGNWDVGNVIYMFSMFQGASSFNQDLAMWSVKQVINWDDIFSGSAMEEEKKPQKFK